MGFVPGSIIKRPVNGFWGLFYNHMGIYIGNDEVVHFSGESKK
ncbi:MAG: lecithin retinol acyltransferase family protein, partial [Candidatus Brocadiae bacterium]|nr:lecithin retinol acyltransferase family protein [Candidatus Brocadiia bacterium]